MFDVGFSELMVIGIVALMVIGPEKLPKVARTVGALLGRMQRYVNDVKADINREIELDEFKKMHTSVQDAAKSIETSMTETMSGFQAQADELNKIASGDIAGLTDSSAVSGTPAPAGGTAAVTDGAAVTAGAAGAAGAVDAVDAVDAVGAATAAADGAAAVPGAAPAAASAAVASAPVDAAALLAAVEAAPGPAAAAQSAAVPVAETGSQSGAQASLLLEPAPTNASGVVPPSKKPAVAA